VESIHRSTYKDLEVIVVDNGSRSEELEKLRRLGASATILELAENRGFTGGNNYGIEYAERHAFDFAFILNNDTIIHEQTIENLIATFNGANDDECPIGIVTPKILFLPEREKIWFAGATLSRWTLTAKLVGYGQVDQGKYDIENDIPWATGCAMLMRIETLKKASGFDERYFAVSEDIDLSLRLRSMGYRIVYQPRAWLWHKESASSDGRDNPQYVYYQVRNYMMFQKIWSRSAVNLFLGRIYLFGYLSKRLAIFLWRRKGRSALALIGGISDGWRMVGGKSVKAY